MGGKELRIDVKLVVLSAVLITLIIAVVGLWSAKTHEQQLRQELVEQARGFAQQMDAVWTFVDANQNRINYTSDGIYEFKGLHCSVAAKAVAQLFNRSTDYVVKFTRTDPRNPGDAPDEWEQGALASFEEDPAIGEYYQLVENDEAMSLRYCTPLTVEEGCLSCHGAPKGEIDITGYAKEGWSMGRYRGRPEHQHPRGTIHRILQRRTCARSRLLHLGNVRRLGHPFLRRTPPRHQAFALGR